MNGKPVTDELVAGWRRLRESNQSYAKIAAITGHNEETVRKHVNDGRRLRSGRPLADPELFKECGEDIKEYNRRRKRKAPQEKKQPGRKIEYPDLLEEVGGDMIEYQRRRKQLNNANRVRSKKQKAKVYDSEKKWNKQWEAAGAPPPRYGRECECSTALLDNEDGYCSWCGRIVAKEKAPAKEAPGPAHIKEVYSRCATTQTVQKTNAAFPTVPATARTATSNLR